MRKFHRVLAIILALPFALVLLTGIVLQLRNVIPSIQPQSLKMERLDGMALKSFEQLIQMSNVPQDQIDQIIFKPNKFHLAIRLKNGQDLQVHPQTGQVLHSAPRYTAFLIELHQGSYWGKVGQYGIIFPASIGLVLLLITGIFIYPWKRSLRKTKFD